MDQLLVILVLAYAWVLALGGLAVREGRTHPFHVCQGGHRRRHWSLFKEGFQFFVEVIQPVNMCPELVFVSDTRFI
jgi:hypothetical protein